MTMPKEECIKRFVGNFPEVDFTIVANVYEYRVEFQVYDMEGVAADGSPLWHRAGSGTHPDPVGTLEEAEVYLHGQVKWDGCSDWHFDEQDRVMLHACDKHGLERFGKVLAMCWDLASKELTTFDA